MTPEEAKRIADAGLEDYDGAPLSRADVAVILARIDAQQDELDDVLVYLRRHERDQMLGITPPTLAELIAGLERREHR